MPIHTVEQGETVDTIARAYAVERSRILDAGENAELFTRRTAFQLFEGDELFIPDDASKQVDVGLCSTVTFRLRPQRLRLRVRFLRGGAPRALEPCSLSVDDGEVQQLSLDRLGWLDTSVEPGAKLARLTFFPNTDHAEVVTLKLGHLDRISETRGVQQRLNNLGFDCGAEDNDAGERTLRQHRRQDRALGRRVLRRLAGRARAPGGWRAQGEAAILPLVPAGLDESPRLRAGVAHHHPCPQRAPPANRPVGGRLRGNSRV